MEIEGIDHMDLAMRFSGAERYCIAFIIIPPIIWKPFRVAASGFFILIRRMPLLFSTPKNSTKEASNDEKETSRTFAREVCVYRSI